MVDPDGRIVLVNREIERLFGYTREELLGRPVEFLVPERYRSGHPSDRAGFFASPRVRAMGAGRELHGLRKDGTEVPVEIGLTPVPSDDGLYVLSSIVDISARKRADARFRAAVESSPNGMVMVDRSGRIVLVNREIERMFGYAREELLGQSIEMLVPERFRRSHPGWRDTFYAEPATRSMGAGRDLFGIRKDGSEIAVEIGLNPIETEEGLFVLSSIVDISRRKALEADRETLERQLRQAQKMEAVGTLAGGIAHDFNNILGTIVGFAELIQDAVADRPGAMADLEELLLACRRGKELIQRILRFSRRQEPVRAPLDLGGLASDATQLLRAAIPTRIDLQIDVAPGLPTVLADATSVHQVLMNLATNAAYAMPDGGQIRISVEPWYVRDSAARRSPGLREGPYALLRVRDTGRGIDPTHLDRVFEPFFTTKPAGEGSGLGLAIVHGIMRDHEGAVQLDSHPGEGTEVRCLFPAVADVEEAVPALDASVPQGTGQRVLVLDDEPTLARLGERRLEGLGYRAARFTDPIRALAALRQAPDDFDLVLTDYSMPGMTGIDFAREVVSIRPDLPILLATGYMDELPSEAIAAAGIRAVLIKPVTMDELARAAALALNAGP